MQSASPDIEKILSDAISHHQAGRLDEAVTGYRLALTLSPTLVGTYNNLGSALCELGRLDEAEASYRRALALNPAHAETHNNLGTALYELGRLDEAVACYRQALAREPDHAQAHNNLGTALFALGKLDQAESCYRRALIARPDDAVALNNLGTLLWEQGKLDEASAAYRRILQINPHDANARDRFAAVAAAQGNLGMALEAIRQSLQNGETEKNRRVFVDIVRQMRWTADNDEIRNFLTRALTEPWARPAELARASAALIKLGGTTGACIRRAQAWPRQLSAGELFGSDGLGALASDRLLIALLTSTQNTDLELERFLTMARRLLLEAATDGAAPGPGLAFYAALAHQCFINEYVFFQDGEEIQQARSLRDRLAAALKSQTPVPPLLLVAVAAYFPLYAIPMAGRLLTMTWPEPIAALLVQQLVEPEEEKLLRGTIPAATSIENAISRLVQTQYEENPYPRWVRAAPAGTANTIIGYLSKRFPLAPFRRQGTSEIPEFLSAGCGTGQLATEFARGITARLLAVDLSLSSLAYAKRKAGALNLTAMAFAQADLLELGTIGRSFDVIECSGVLHHMADPLAGWRLLLSLLRPDGFMMLGLYSQTARRDIVRAKRVIAQLGYGPNADDIRRCRQDLLDRHEIDNFGVVTSNSDFFGISTCRDLLFHAQEQQMTLAGIDGFLRDNELRFLGFEISGEVLQAYRQRFPDDPAATDLKSWEVFEAENPDSFIGMYNFWVQKAGP